MTKRTDPATPDLTRRERRIEDARFGTKVRRMPIWAKVVPPVIALLVVAGAAFVLRGSDTGSAPQATPKVESAAAASTTTIAPTTTVAPTTEPPATTPPATEPPVTEPVVTEPPAGEVVIPEYTGPPVVLDPNATLPEGPLFGAEDSPPHPGTPFLPQDI